MKTCKLILFSSILSVFITSCYTYNVPSGATTPLITKRGATKSSVAGNFNEAGGTFTTALTDRVLFTASGNFIFSKNNYKQDYDSLFYKKIPNNFEVAFGYYGGLKKFANNIMFGVGTGNNFYNYGTIGNRYLDGYFQANFVQYFLQYTAGFKYDKTRGSKKKYKEQGMSLRYGYHNYHLVGISQEYTYEEVWNEELGYYDYIENIIISKEEQSGLFNSFSVYYFYRTGNDKIQFEISPGFTVYDKRFHFYKQNEFTNTLHFNVGLIFNLNNLFVGR